MREKTKQKADQRLARIEGQVRAVRRMVEADKYCVDVVRQIQAMHAKLTLQGSCHPLQIAALPE